MMIRAATLLVLPLARRWVAGEEARALAEGVPLTAAQARDAVRAGVRAPERVRLRCVDVIPVPYGALVRRAGPLGRIVSGSTIGITFGHGVCLRRDYWDDRALLLHELVHVAQYERLGGIRPFLQAYLDECLRLGYPHGPLEAEARQRTEEVLLSDE